MDPVSSVKGANCVQRGAGVEIQPLLAYSFLDSCMGLQDILLAAVSSSLAIEGKMSNSGDFSYPSVTKQLLFSNCDIQTYPKSWVSFLQILLLGNTDRLKHVKVCDLIFLMRSQVLFPPIFWL